MRDASKFFLLQEPTSADLLWFLTYRDMSSYVSKYTRFHIHSFYYIVPNVSNSDAGQIDQIPQIRIINHIALHNNVIFVTKK